MTNDTPGKSAKFCSECGAELTPGQKFCQKCGNRLAPASPEDDIRSEQTAQPAQSADQEQINTATDQTADIATDQTAQTVAQAANIPVSDLAEQFAPSVAGELSLGTFGGLSGAAGADGIVSPLETVISSAKDAVGNVIGIMKNKQWKKLIIAGVLAIVWIILMILSYNGIHIGLLNWLTFARGGMGRTAIGWVGGLLGKFTLATAVFSLVDGGYRLVGGGCKALLDRNHFQVQNLGWLLSGAGTALVIYQFFAGNAIWTDTMSAISGGILAIMALGSGGGFLFRLAQSLTAKVSGKTRIPENGKATALLSGVTFGFALGVVVSFIPFGWLPIIW